MLCATRWRLKSPVQGLLHDDGPVDIWIPAFRRPEPIQEGKKTADADQATRAAGARCGAALCLLAHSMAVVARSGRVR